MWDNNVVGNRIVKVNSPTKIAIGAALSLRTTTPATLPEDFSDARRGHQQVALSFVVA